MLLPSARTRLAPSNVDICFLIVDFMMLSYRLNMKVHCVPSFMMVLDGSSPVWASACLIAAWQYSLKGKGVWNLLLFNAMKASNLSSFAKLG